jgi:4-amino-4-deoxy-L-arabinose transferase-like glycosyltransferase
MAAWIAIGSAFLPTAVRNNDGLVTPCSILIGSAATAFVYALLTRLGFVTAAVVLVFLVSAAVLFLQRSEVRRIIETTREPLRSVLETNRVVRLACWPVAVLLWVYAIAPPRDGDVMRYHLAHIRQIIVDGGWEAIADYHYAFPFGWSLNYLPFEWLHLPQAAALVNAALWIVIVAGLLRLARKSDSPRIAQLVAVLFFVHPFVIRTFASAMVDAYAILMVFTVALLLLRLHDTRRVAVLLGFACWIGAQSRYQLVALGIAGTAVFLMDSARRRTWRRGKRFALGTAVALALASPFYVANLNDFGNPVWPLLVPFINGTTSYADQVAAAYTQAMTGPRDPLYALHQLWALVRTPSLVPIPIAVLLIVPLGFRGTSSALRRVAWLGLFFLVLWVVMEPHLFPRHILLLLPVAALLFVPALAGLWSRERLTRVVDRVLVGAIAASILLSAIFAWDYVRYDLTGDKTAYHKFTWYYPVYDWINMNTSRDARFLVIVYSGHSYYLDRPYRRADPWLSGVVDWSHVASATDLGRVLMHGGYQYVVYDDRDWRGFPGGAEMQYTVKSAITTRLLVPVHTERERLYTGRVTRSFEETNVYVLRLAAGSASAAGVPLPGKNASLKR